MHIVIEVSRPAIRPGWYRSKGITTLSIWAGWFAISIHPMRQDELLDGAGDGRYRWAKRP